MGLTIHWEFAADVSADAARGMVEQMYARAKELNFDRVLEMAEWDREEDSAGEFWGTWLLRHRVNESEEQSIFIPPKHAIMFVVTHEGAEPAAFGLATHPAVISQHRNGRDIEIPTGLSPNYRWQYACKTQYAGLPMYGGFDNFYRVHGSIVAVLDEARRLGVLKEVVDEGKYWDHRDADQLHAELDKWNGLVAAFAGKLKDLYGDANRDKWIATITEDPSFEHLEAKGQEMMRGYDEDDDGHRDTNQQDEDEDTNRENDST